MKTSIKIARLLQKINFMENEIRILEQSMEDQHGIRFGQSSVNRGAMLNDS